MIERALKKGKGGEIEAGSRLAVLLALQVSDPENIYKELRSVLVTMLNDKTSPAASRASVSTSLAGLCFLGGGEMTEVVTSYVKYSNIYHRQVLGTMAALEDVYTLWSKPDLPADLASLVASAVSGWSLLLSLQSPGEVHRWDGVSDKDGTLNLNDLNKF